MTNEELIKLLQQYPPKEEVRVGCEDGGSYGLNGVATAATQDFTEILVDYRDFLH